MFGLAPCGADGLTKNSRPHNEEFLSVGKSSPFKSYLHAPVLGRTQHMFFVVVVKVTRYSAIMDLSELYQSVSCSSKLDVSVDDLSGYTRGICAHENVRIQHCVSRLYKLLTKSINS